MIYYIFEDKRDDILTSLFREAYSKDVSDNFIYTNGNTNIYDKVLGLLRTDSECTVAVYMDVIPGNKECIKDYNRLMALIRNNRHRAVLFPIVCLEWYMIEALCRYSKYIDINNDVEIARSKGDYRQSKIYAQSNGKCKNFEKYCKFILKNYVKDCINTSKGPDGCESNKHHSLYYTKNCKCHMHMDDCTEKPLLRKSLELLSIFDCIPANVNYSTKEPVSLMEAQHISDRLADEFNRWSDEYAKIDIKGFGDASKYKHILKMN